MASTPSGLEHWAVETPDAPALLDGERRVTWHALNDMADRAATALGAMGLGPGDTLAVRARVCTEWAVVAYAAAKLGCRLAAINRRLTAPETHRLLEDSDAVALVCDDDDMTAVSETRELTSLRLAVKIGSPSSGFLPFPELLKRPGLPLRASSDCTLVIFTSGTTGRPKGVALQNPPPWADPEAVREYRASADASHPGATDKVSLLSLPLFHAGGWVQLRAAIQAGRTTVLQRHFDPEETLTLIARHRVNRWVAVPTMFQRIRDLPSQVLASHDVSSIEYLRVGGAPVSPALKDWIARYFGPVLQESYGATEVGTISGMQPEMLASKPHSCGKLFSHVQAQARDGDGVVLPTSATGLIWVRTPVVIRNYLNQPPLGPETLDGDGFFNTGDIGHVDEDGYLYITGRAKDMIISGGINVYPAEIEAVLGRHPAIAESAVIGVPDADLGERPMALCRIAPGQHVSAEELQAHCAAALASHKRPRRYEFVEDFPRNATGKVLKQELRQPYWIGKEQAT